MAKKEAPATTTESKPKAKSSRLSQSVVPRHSLREALTIAQAITDHFASDATSPLQVAMAIDVSPTSSGWRTLTGAAIAYGLTNGGCNSDKIELTDLGRRCTAPTLEGDDVVARAEAALKPDVLNKFFSKYNRAKFPPDNIAKNVLQQDFGVPADRLAEVLELLKDNGAYVGFIHETKTGPFVSTEDLKPGPVTLRSDEEHPEDEPAPEGEEAQSDQVLAPPAPPAVQPAAQSQPFRVFITHGKNKKIVEQVKDVLDLYDIEYEIAVEEESPAIPVSQKVLSAMRKCSAGVMIVSADDESAAAAGTINNNVLIEIGAAFVLYDQQVVLLWDRRLKVPSNLQGLYRCEFEGDDLSFAAGTKLSKAVKGFKKP